MSVIEEAGSPIAPVCSLTHIHCKHSRSSEGDKKFARERIPISASASDFQTKLFGSPNSEQTASVTIDNDGALIIPCSFVTVDEEAGIETIQQDMSTQNDETNDEKSKREQRESELLAWEMLRQESIELYQMQIDFMRENAGEMSEEDINALQMAINESGRPDIYYSSQISNANNSSDSAQGTDEVDGDEDNSQSMESSEADVEEGEDSDNWDYDRLLALGQVLGDVKTDRWRQKAPAVIASLPTTTYSCIQQQVSAAQTHIHSTALLPPPTPAYELRPPRPPQSAMSLAIDYRCAVCMEDFEAADKLSLLPSTTSSTPTPAAAAGCRIITPAPSA
eukprot:CAMPEP_0170100606 /NCGR_PEP_ID=MMETSP0020_2-20130122/1756_1 /TAXON_ID=98059 /ORGANISM="Dinobryon sp., Strain UTEXLB2267" /LENGTH=335 /DNA_ID=CAMNT_0010323529 /DNA_START=14 /DNA_END=1018 /DNA_ORIENTATION=+